MPYGSPLSLLLATVAGWLNRHQAQAIEYLVEEKRVLKEQLGSRRLAETERLGGLLRSYHRAAA